VQPLNLTRSENPKKSSSLIRQLLVVNSLKAIQKEFADSVRLYEDFLLISFEREGQTNLFRIKNDWKFLNDLFLSGDLKISGLSYKQGVLRNSTDGLFIDGFLPSSNFSYFNFTEDQSKTMIYDLLHSLFAHICESLNLITGAPSIFETEVNNSTLKIQGVSDYE
jgi:DNA-binding transcriptional ArsR family regulator